jgi:hypothetical protein
MSIMKDFSDIGRVCKAAASIAECARGHLSECIGQQVYRYTNLLEKNVCSFVFI